MEFRIVSRICRGHDFYEGVRATIVDKDNAPHWRPAPGEPIAEAAIDAYFAPLPRADELTFPEPAGGEDVMRQSRDGVTQIVERRRAPGDGAAAGCGAAEVGATRWSGSCARSPGCGSPRACSTGPWCSALFPRSAISPMLPRALQGAIVFFAAVDLLAAVGLWLAAPWGGVLWLAVRGRSRPFRRRSARAAPRRRARRRGSTSLLVAIYFVLSWRAGPGAES